MILYYQTHSPFARKALVFAHEVGIADRLEVIHHETSPTLRNADVYAENPLGKVPVLLRPNASPIFDSDVICAYLDTLHDGRKLLPQDGEARWQALRLQSVAQGLAQTGIALRWETERRPEKLRYGALADGYREKIKGELRLDRKRAGRRGTAPCRPHRLGHHAVLDGVPPPAAFSLAGTADALVRGFRKTRIDAGDTAFR